MRGVNRLSASCCSLPIAASVVPASSPRAGSTDPNRASPDTCDRTARTTLPLPHLRRARNRADLPVPGRPLPVGPEQGRSSSLGIVGCPSSSVPTRVHSPRARALVRTSAWRPRFSFRPCGLSPLRRFPPQHGVRACCIPVPDMGFAGFQRSRRVLNALRRPWAEPGSGFGRDPHSHQRYTLRRFSPRRQPFPITGFCSLLTVQLGTMSPSLARRTRVDAQRSRKWLPTGRLPAGCVARSNEACSRHDG